MSESTPPHFDLETIAFMREVLSDAWAALSPTERARTTQTVLAERIMKAAAAGERDPERLVEAALDREPAS